MPYLGGEISQSGPIMGISVSVSQSRQKELEDANIPVPTSLILNGMIDTGASGTHVDPAAIAPLGLVPRGQIHCTTASTDEKGALLDQYELGLSIYQNTLPHGHGFIIFPVILATASSLRHQGFDILIGRDVLARCLFVYDGRRNIFSLAF